MYKRVEKRRRKQSKEEELGLTEEMKEVLGMHDTDSDESDSSSSSGPSEMAGDSDEDLEMDAEQSADDEVPKQRNVKISSKKRPREVDEGSEDEDEYEGGGDADEEEEDEDEDEGDEGSDEEESIDHDRPSISVTEAVRDPIYTIPSQPNLNLKRCVVCPGKDLKNDQMAEIHRASKAHYRRFARFVEFAGTADPETDVKEFWDFLNKPSQPKISEKNKHDTDGQVELSKRAQKRKEKLEAVKVKRARAKKAKAHSIAKRQAAKEAKLAAAQQGEQGTTNTKPQNDTTSKPNLSESPSTTKQKSKADGKTKGKKKANRHEQADSTQVAESTPVSVPTPEKPPKKKQKVGGGRNVIPPSNAPSTTPALEAANTLPPSRPDKPIRTKPSKDSVLSAKMTKTVKAHSSSKSTTRKLHKALASDKSRSLGSSRTKKSLAS